MFRVFELRDFSLTNEICHEFILNFCVTGTVPAVPDENIGLVGSGEVSRIPSNRERARVPAGPAGARPKTKWVTETDTNENRVGGGKCSGGVLVTRSKHGQRWSPIFWS